MTRPLHERSAEEWHEALIAQLEHHGLGKRTDPKLRNAAAHVAMVVRAAIDDARNQRPQRVSARRVSRSST